jgi:hypothetical protein
MLLLAISVASAGGWSIVRLDALVPDVIAGEGTSVGFTVLRHGETPISGLQPFITALNAESGERLSFDAMPQGAAGHYVAQITFPSQGKWEWSVNAFEGEHPMPALNVVETVPTGVVTLGEIFPIEGATALTATLSPVRWVAVGFGLTGAALPRLRRSSRSCPTTHSRSPSSTYSGLESVKAM